MEWGGGLAKCPYLSSKMVQKRGKQSAWGNGELCMLGDLLILRKGRRIVFPSIFK